MMRTSHRNLLSTTMLAAALALTYSPATHADEIYGLGGAWTVIPAAEFHPNDPTCPLQYVGNYLYQRTGGCTGSYPGWYEYPLHLPEGASIYALRLIALDNDATAGNDVTLQLTHATLTPYYAGASSSYTYSYVPNANASTSGASTSLQGAGNTTSFSQTFDTYDHTTAVAEFYSLRLIVPASSSLGVHSVHVYWRRQIAPAPASATFSDVPTTHPFFNEVAQLSKSGITQGCGGGNFCPDSPVTRGQMAAFLSRALGLHWDWGTN